MKYFNILVLAWLFGAGCCCTSHPGSATAVDETRMAAGKYVVRQPELKVDLDLWRNGSYLMSAEGSSGAAAASESGFWTLEGPDLILNPQNGAAGANLRRLRPAPGSAGQQSFVVVENDYQGPSTLTGLSFEREGP
jgi:hypothetical protein